MPVANTRPGAYSWWLPTNSVKILHSHFPELHINQIIEAVRIAGPDAGAIRRFIAEHYMGASGVYYTSAQGNNADKQLRSNPITHYK